MRNFKYLGKEVSSFGCPTSWRFSFTRRVDTSHWWCFWEESSYEEYTIYIKRSLGIHHWSWLSGEKVYCGKEDDIKFETALSEYLCERNLGSIDEVSVESYVEGKKFLKSLCPEITKISITCPHCRESVLSVKEELSNTTQCRKWSWICPLCVKETIQYDFTEL